jgi:hypothetical protein
LFTFSPMTDLMKISLPTIDAAFDQALSAAAQDASSLEKLGHNHGVRLLRQRFGGQFLKNQGHFLTSDQQNECVSALQKEVAQRSAPPPDLTPLHVRIEETYWRGFDHGVTTYAQRLTQAAAPGAPEPLPRRRRQP